MKEKEGAETREVVVFGPQVNLGIANFKVGYNYILTCDSCAHMGVARMRVLLGVDVIKLISGEDSAAL